MTPVVSEALALWDMEGADCALVARRENEVWQVRTSTETFALRLHRVGYRSKAELRSELDWMAALARARLGVPAPVASRTGAFIELVHGVQVDVLGWLDGKPVGATGQPLAHTNRLGLFHSIGQEAALLHLASDDWTLPKGFTRHAWDRDGLVGDDPIWGPFWDNPTLTETDRQDLLRFRDLARLEFDRPDACTDYGLIHADMVRENLMVDGDRVQIIDFDDGGFGYRMFEIATILLKNLPERDFPALRAAVLDGYRTVRPLDETALDFFLALRAATYVGWVVPRLDEDGAATRNARFIKTCMPLVRVWLNECQGTSQATP